LNESKPFQMCDHIYICKAKFHWKMQSCQKEINAIGNFTCGTHEMKISSRWLYVGLKFMELLKFKFARFTCLFKFHKSVWLRRESSEHMVGHIRADHSCGSVLVLLVMFYNLPFIIFLSFMYYHCPLKCWKGQKCTHQIQIDEGHHFSEHVSSTLL